MRALFAVEDVSKIFPPVRALKRRPFGLVPGEVGALMGETMAA
jgi:ABC-type sugar transport system ATPase subunit